ncbi:MAG: transposase [Acidimicrobiia bacterium]|nr:transposase [Acidimicrobiia bacterium]
MARTPAFAELARRIRRHRPAIERTLEWRISNRLVESTNTKIRHSTDAPSGSTNPSASSPSPCSPSAATAPTPTAK